MPLPSFFPSYWVISPSSYSFTPVSSLETLFSGTFALFLSLGVSVFHTASAMIMVYSTSMLLVFSHTQVLSGSYMVTVWWFKCKLCGKEPPSNSCKDTHRTDTHNVHRHTLIPPPSLDTQTRTGVVNHITQPSPSLTPTPSLSVSLSHAIRSNPRVCP